MKTLPCLICLGVLATVVVLVIVSALGVQFSLWLAVARVIGFGSAAALLAIGGADSAPRRPYRAPAARPVSQEADDRAADRAGTEQVLATLGLGSDPATISPR